MDSELRNFMSCSNLRLWPVLFYSLKAAKFQNFNSWLFLLVAFTIKNVMWCSLIAWFLSCQEIWRGNATVMVRLFCSFLRSPGIDFGGDPHTKVTNYSTSVTYVVQNRYMIHLNSRGSWLAYNLRIESWLHHRAQSIFFIK